MGLFKRTEEAENRPAGLGFGVLVLGVVWTGIAWMGWSDSRATDWQDLAVLSFEPGTADPDTSVDPLPSGTELWVEGVIDGSESVTLILDLTDRDSQGYAQRWSQERDMAPGPFTFPIPLAGLKAPSGRLLDPDQLSEARLFLAAGTAGEHRATLSLRRPPVLPDGVVALDFGPKDAPVFPGFRPLGPEDPRITCDPCRPIARPGAPVLTGDGLGGVTRMTLPAPERLYDLVIWTEDPGEWEYLPHPRERRIRINGTTVLEERPSPEDWVRERYLAGTPPVARRGQMVLDPWQAFGQRRGGRIQIRVAPVDGHIVIDLAGDSMAATHVAGVVLVPVTSATLDPAQDVLARIRAQRRERFLNAWPVLPSSPSAEAVPPEPVLVAGQRGFVTVELAPDSDSGSVLHSLRVDGPVGLGSEGVWVARQRLVRSGPSKRSLVRNWSALIPVDAHTLVSAIDRLPSGGWSVALGFDVPSDVPPGSYPVVVHYGVGGHAESQEIAVQVLPAGFDMAASGIGVYLEPQMTDVWFDLAAETRAACDMAWLSSLGLGAVSPPLPLPQGKDPNSQAAFVRAVRGAQGQFPAGVLSYTTVKRLIGVVGIAGAAEELAAVLNRVPDLSDHVTWSIADEPSNPVSAGDGTGVARIRSIAEHLRAVQPDIRLAGHLNHPEDAAIAALFDQVLINGGYGADARRIRELKAIGVEPWLYNMADPAYAAGWHAWRIGADGYLQWHARMATADPFDPTDGREDDFNLLFPTVDPCPARRPFDRQLLDLATAALDRALLQELDSRASGGDRAALALQTRMLDRVSPDWQPDDLPTHGERMQWRRDLLAVLYAEGA